LEAIGKYERDESQPSVETAKKIADALGVTLDYLVDEDALPTFDKKTVNRLKGKFVTASYRLRPNYRSRNKKRKASTKTLSPIPVQNNSLTTIYSFGQ